VTIKTMCLGLQRHKLPLKKSLQASERDSERAKRLRAAFARRRRDFASGRLRLIDETGMSWP
jgi:hypothetical protein